MYSFAIAEAGSSDQLWAWFQARGAVGDAIEALESAGGALLSLTADTEWHSQGVAALHRKLADFQDRAALETARLHNRESELASMGIA